MKNIRAFIDDFREVRPVGSEKPLGYTCRYKSELSEGEVWRPLSLKFCCYAWGLETQFEHEGRALYVYHREALQEILNGGADILAHYGWSTNIEEFISNIAPENVCPKTDLFDLIADAFADYENFWRTDVETPPEALENLRRHLKDDPQDFLNPFPEI